MPAVVPWPLLDWTRVVHAWDPARKATQARLRTLRDRHHAVSKGMTVTQRGSRGMSGSTTSMCALNVFAAVLERRGEHDLASLYAGAASDLEAKWQKRLQTAHSEGVEQDRKLLLAFACDVEDRRSSLPDVNDFVFLRGKVTSVEGSWARASGTGSDESKVVDLPLDMVEANQIELGDFIVVFRDRLPSGGLNLWCLRGVSLDETSSAVEHNNNLVSSDSSWSPVQQRALTPLDEDLRARALEFLSKPSAPRILRPAG